MENFNGNEENDYEFESAELKNAEKEDKKRQAELKKLKKMAQLTDDQLEMVAQRARDLGLASPERVRDLLFEEGFAQLPDTVQISAKSKDSSSPPLY